MPDPLYTAEQRGNIRLGYHPDCGLAKHCRACGASEDVGGGACMGRLAENSLVLNLFQVALANDCNATRVSLGYAPHNREEMGHTARTCDASARILVGKKLRFSVVLHHPDVGDMLCKRNYPRFDHLDPWYYHEDEREAVEQQLAILRERFPQMSYTIKTEIAP